MCAFDESETIESGDSETIETERLLLRAPRHDEAPVIVKLANDRRIAEMAMSIPYPYHEADAHEWIDKSVGNAGPGLGKFLLWRKANGGVLDALVGACGIVQLPDHDEIFIGYWTGAPFWGRGYATEAAHAVIDYFFASGNHDALTAACRVTNPASRRVIEKCGFQFRSNSIIPSVGAGGIVSVECFVLERSVWASLKAW